MVDDTDRNRAFVDGARNSVARLSARLAEVTEQLMAAISARDVWKRRAELARIEGQRIMQGEFDEERKRLTNVNAALPQAYSKVRAERDGLGAELAQVTMHRDVPDHQHHTGGTVYTGPVRRSRD